MESKDSSVETLRGIAIILMVSGHVIGANPFEGMKVADDSPWRFMYNLLINIRMPLFTVISGYVYALKPVHANSKLTIFLKGKIRRLIFPLITISTIQYLFQCYTPGVNASHEIKNIWKIYIYPYSHFWFIQAIFIVFLIVAFLDYNNYISTIKKWILMLFVSSLLFIFLKPPFIFSLNSAFYLLPFFMLGTGIRKFENILLKNKALIWSIFIIFLIFMLLQQFSYLIRPEIEVGRISFIGLLIGLSSTFLLFKIRFSNKLLAFIGYYSYGIFLLHLFGSASSRILLKYMDVSNNLIIFVVGLMAGILVPLFIQLIISKSKIMRTALLGLK